MSDRFDIAPVRIRYMVFLQGEGETAFYNHVGKDVGDLIAEVDHLQAVPSVEEIAQRIDVMVKERDAEIKRLREACKATLMFHRECVWDTVKQQEWYELTGDPAATTKVLCDFVRRALAEVGINDD